MGGPGSGPRKGKSKGISKYGKTNPYASKNEPRIVKQKKYATNKIQTLVKSKKTGNYGVVRGGSSAISRRLKG